ncbi:MAG: DUF4157 domain-containing protein [Proteobacteria bacterium]|nr:DUF4157 domain-containing protein [Pseudomonadota bacterium]
MKRAPEKQQKPANRAARLPALGSPAAQPAPFSQPEPPSELEQFQQGAGNAVMVQCALAAGAQDDDSGAEIAPSGAVLFEASRRALERTSEPRDPGQPGPASAYQSIIAVAQRPALQAKCPACAAQKAGQTQPAPSGVEVHGPGAVQAKCPACEAKKEAAAEPATESGAMSEPRDPGQSGPANAYQSIIAVAQRPALQAKCPACAAQKAGQTQPAPSGAPATEPGAMQQSARQGLAGADQPLPHGERIQASFGRHDISATRVQIGGAAARASRDMGALAFTSGARIGFGQPPELRLAAHEAAHVVQQREGLSVPGNVGRPDDRWERNADQVADAVVAGRSAEPLLDRITGSTPHAARPQPSGTKPAPNRAIIQPQVVQRQEPAATEPAPLANQPDKTSAPALIVEDSAQGLESGQMKKSDFLRSARDAVCRAVSGVLAAAGRSTDDCPYLGFVFLYFGIRNAEYTNRVVSRFAPGTARVTSAAGYIPFIAERARRSAEGWVRTGTISDLPRGVPTDLLAGTLRAAAGANLLSGAGRLLSDLGNTFRKSRDGRGAPAADPLQIQAQLGPGRGLDSRVQSGMGTAFGRDFSGVRVHTDAHAGQLSSRMNARAFTVGQDIAFAPSEYQPGTLAGDALIAHELAHVAQQKDASTPGSAMAKGQSDDSALEVEADNAAVGGVLSLWTAAKGKLATVANNAMPRLKSQLRLQRCSTPQYSSPQEAAIGELDSASFDENAVLQAFRSASEEDIRTAVQALKLRPHLEHVNYYRYLLSSMNADLNEQEWREFEGIVGNVAITGEAPIALSREAQQLLAFFEQQLEDMDVGQLLRQMRGASAADLDAALTTLRRRYNSEHGHELHRLSAEVRDDATEEQYRQFVSLLHQAGITLALRETDPRIGVVVERETQLIGEGAQTSLSDEEMAGLFGTRALEIALTMLRNSEQQLLQVMTRSRGTGATASQFDADIDKARRAYGLITGKVPTFTPFRDYAARVTSRLQATGQTVSQAALRQAYDRERQIIMHRLAAPEQARILDTIERKNRRIRELRDIVRRPITYIGRHPLDLAGPAGAHKRRQAAIRTRQRQRAELRRLEGETERLTRHKQVLEEAMPLLGGLDVGDLRRLAALRGGSAEFDQLLAQALAQVFRNIEASRAYLQSGDVKIWLLRPVVEATRRQLGIPENSTNEAHQRWQRVIRGQIARAQADERKVRETLQAINAGLLIVALGTALFSGGGSLALYATLTGTAIGVGSSIYGAIDTTMETMERRATHGSGLTVRTRLSDVPPDYEFLVHAWLGVGLEVGLAVFGIRSMARSGALSQLRGDAVAVRRRVRDLVRRLRRRGAAVSERQLVDSTMTALEQRGWIGATGGVRGPTNYALTGNTGPERLANQVSRLPGRPRAMNAEFINPSDSSRSLSYQLRVPMRGTSGRHVTVAVEVESVPQAQLAAAGHAAEAGPARLILTRRPGRAGWRAKIQVAREIRHQDVQFVVGHELDEAARIVRASPKATAATIAEQQEASLFRRGGSARVTAHDRAAADELRALNDELQPYLARARGIPQGQPVPADLANNIAWRQSRLGRVMDSMGLGEATNKATKLRILREAGVSDDLIKGIQARWQQASYFASPGFQALERSSPNLRAAGSIMGDQRLVRHLMAPGPSRGGFVANGIHGGHHTGSLQEFVRNHPQYYLVEAASRPAARTTFRRYFQFRWRGNGPKPGPGDPRLPTSPGPGNTPVAGTHYDSNLWQLSTQPKTTADSLQILMREADDAWIRWRTANPGPATNPAMREFGGPGGVPPAVSGNGVHFAGFYTYDPASGTWRINTMFMEASWIP